MKRLIAFISILMLLAPMAMAATGTVRIWGTNPQNAQSNTSVSGAPQNITIAAFNGNTTTFFSTVNNATDTLTFSIANQTIGRFMELRINGTVINAYQVNSTGWVTFTRTQLLSNQTYKLTPAINQGGFNFTWGRFENLQGLWNNYTAHGSARAYDTVYQNNNSIPRFISTVCWVGATDGSIYVYIGLTNPPTIKIIDAPCIAASLGVTFSYIVLPNEYYKAAISGGSPTVRTWTEWDLI